MSLHYLGSTGEENQSNFYIGERESSLNITFDGGGAALTTGVVAYVNVPYDGNVTSSVLLADITGHVVLDYWKGVYDDYPLTASKTMATGTGAMAAVKINIDNNIKSRQTNFTGWNSRVFAGDIIGVRIDNVTGITWLSAQLKIN